MFQTRLWRHPDFTRLWLAQAISAFGARITREGLPIAAALSLGASPAQVGLLAAVANGPALLVALAAGGRVDRGKRRGLMMAADLVRAAMLASLPIAALLHALTLPHLYLAAAVVGAASVLFEIADHAFLPTLVERDDLMEANASLSATESVAEIGGPALAGVLFQLLTAPLAIAVNAATYLASALSLAMIRSREHEPEAAAGPAPRWTDDIALGFAALWRNLLTRPVFLITALHGFFGGAFAALYILFCVRVVQLSPAQMGLTIACGGVGALAGALLAGRITQLLGIGRALLLALSMVALSVLLIPLAPANPSGGMAVLMTGQVLGDAFGVAIMILSASLTQSLLPSALLGRAGAALKATGGGLAVAGALLGGLAGEIVGVRGALWLGVAGFLATPLVVLASPLVRLREMPERLADEDPAVGKAG